ncbi:RINT1-like protein MAG2 isoform X2 [Cucumis sativus]|nr:RINT1-like protein MAG2 isoform X2 [Cucumis sativus]
MKLDCMVGDIEDAVSSAINKNLRKQSSEDARLLAIKTFKLTEDILVSVSKTRPQWTHLVSAVDHRVDRALAILRPQAIADHRSLLSSLGWPPSLSTVTVTGDATKSTESQNPLFTMQGKLKQQYCENFLALCSLQEIQRRRKSRQLEGYSKEVSLPQPLWAIEELVNPISLAAQEHFSKWIDKPEFIFILTYKITRDYVDSIDEVLQPLVDEARLVGYSCREEWISSMVTSLSTYLAKEIFPNYIRQLDEDSNIGIQSQARISWLHLVDLMISFDKRIKSLVEQSGLLLSFDENGNLQRLSSLAVFCDRPDWLDLWAEMERSDAMLKLQIEVDNERNWSDKIPAAALPSSSEHSKSPAISTVFIKHLSSLVYRCQSLPSITLRSRFFKLAGSPIIANVFNCVLIRCQEAEGLTALTDDDALVKVANSINAARYFESILKEWCEDMFFLEMGSASDELLASPSTGIIDSEIRKFEEFRREWVEKISTVILRGFDAQSRDYIKNKKQWKEKCEDGWTVSRLLIGALDYLQGKMLTLEKNLNGIDFVSLWRTLAAGVDRFIFNGILMSNVQFNNDGVKRFGDDMEVLFGIFRSWCLRPEGFFPKISESMKLLKMKEEQLKSSLVGEQSWMKENGVKHLSTSEVDRIVKSRML